ncbi:MAG TPA: hypothetical protein VNN80_11240 [Polyangiaceae bacterium]|nr:hypothetical protein [Polyangiaceae bacterium]
MRRPVQKFQTFLLVAFSAGGWACAGDGNEAASDPGVGTTTAGTSTEAGTLEDGAVDETQNALLGRFRVEERGEAERVLDALGQAEGCLVATLQRGSSASQYLSRAYDATERVVTERPVDATGASTDASDPNLSRAVYFRYSAAGHLLLRAGGGSGYRSFRHDFARDARDNVTEFLFTYEDQLDLQAPPRSAPYMSTDYSNVYDADGRLVEHTVTADVGGLGASVSYTHDAQGRCETTRAERAQEVRTRHREYDDAGRLSRIREDVTSGVGGEYETVTTFGYDEQGRMTSSDTDGAGVWAILPVDGRLDAFTRVSYAADGSKYVERVDFSGDEVNDELTVDGELRQGWRSFELSSPACQVLDAARPQPLEAGCRADD